MRREKEKRESLGGKTDQNPEPRGEVDCTYTHGGRTRGSRSNFIRARGLLYHFASRSANLPCRSRSLLRSHSERPHSLTFQRYPYRLRVGLAVLR